MLGDIFYEIVYYCWHIYNKVSAIFVPATAGIQGRQGVLGLNGRKGCVDGLYYVNIKVYTISVLCIYI